MILAAWRNMCSWRNMWQVLLKKVTTQRNSSPTYHFPLQNLFPKIKFKMFISVFLYGKKWKKAFWRESWYLVLLPTSLYYPLHILSVYLLPSSSSRFIYFFPISFTSTTVNSQKKKLMSAILSGL